MQHYALARTGVTESSWPASVTVKGATYEDGAVVIALAGTAGFIMFPVADGLPAKADGGGIPGGTDAGLPAKA